MTCSPSDVLDRLVEATNRHDLDGIVACFAARYRNETPAHPMRGFVGADQVRRNWAQLLAGVPDLTAQVVGRAVDGDTVWSEWRLSGTRPDGARHEMRGVIIFAVTDGQVGAARFYLEPVEHDSGTVDDAVRRAAAIPPGAAGEGP